MAADLSHRLGWLPTQALERTIHLIERAKLPITPPKEMTAERFLQLMAVDKKVMDGRLRFVLLKEIGHSLVTDDFDKQQLELTLSENGG